MVVCELKFICQQDLPLEQAQIVITELLDELRYNGQIIGREFALTLNNDEFVCHLVCPETDSMDSKYYTVDIVEILQELQEIGIAGPFTEVKGLESQSDFTDQCSKPKGYILYSTFVQSCSPIRCSEHFMPIPLYKLPEIVRRPLIKWQESQAACDQLQMNEMTEIEAMMVEQLSNPSSQLLTQGRSILDDIQRVTGQPAYQYLYRVGGESLESEKNRRCPSCGDAWAIDESWQENKPSSESNSWSENKTPLFGLFDFKCENCQVLSNISWDWQ